MFKKNKRYCAEGGDIKKATPTSYMDAGTPTPVFGDKNYDTIPTYLYYAKAMKDGNAAGAELALKHVRDIKGPQTATDLSFLGKSLSSASLNDIARREYSTNSNPELRRFYQQVNENPDLLAQFGYSMPDQPVAAKKRGGFVFNPKRMC